MAYDSPDTDSKQLARDIIGRQAELESIRADYEPVWQTVADFTDPDGPVTDWSARHSTSRTDGQASRAEERSRTNYDSTASSGGNRLTAGLESLITPQNEKWHGLSTAAMNDEETDEEKEWGEGLRDYLFQDIRYNAASNFVPAIQSCYHNVVHYGPAYLYAEEGFTGIHLRYCSIPVNEAFIARDRWGEPDIFHRCYVRSVRQCVGLFTYEKLPPRIKELADDPVKCMEQVSLIQCVQRRNDRRTYDRAGERGYLDSEWASYHVIADEEHVVKQGGFQAFPISCFNWRRHDNDTYGTSPMIAALTTVREVNAVRRTGLRALQQMTDPATASSAKSDDIPVLNPGVNYPGMLDDATGRPKVVPINVGQDPTVAFQYAAGRAEEIRDMLFVNLFQTLIQNPKMTATEALIRQEEKGALLGPAGSVIQRGFASNLDRELAVLENKGLYAQDSRFLPPPSLAGKGIRPTFTGPLDILRRAAEKRDTIQLVGTAIQMAQVEPSVMDNLDTDETFRVLQSAGRSPQRIIRDKDSVDGIRKARAAAQKAQQGAQALAMAAQAAKDAVPAAVQAKQSGMLDGLPGMMQPPA